MNEIIIYLFLQACMHCDSYNTLNKNDCARKLLECSLDESISWCFDQRNFDEVISGEILANNDYSKSCNKPIDRKVDKKEKQ